MVAICVSVLLMGVRPIVPEPNVTVCWSWARTSQRLAGRLSSLAVCSAYVLSKPTQVCCQGLQPACSSHARCDELPGRAKQMGHPRLNGPGSVPFDRSRPMIAMVAVQVDARDSLVCRFPMITEHAVSILIP